MPALQVSLAVATSFRLDQPIDARLLVLDSRGEPLTNLSDTDVEIRVLGFTHRSVSPVPARPYTDRDTGEAITPTLVRSAGYPGHYLLNLHLPASEVVWPEEAVVRVAVRRGFDRGEAIAVRPSRTLEQIVFETAQSLDRSLREVEQRLRALEEPVRVTQHTASARG